MRKKTFPKGIIKRIKRRLKKLNIKIKRLIASFLDENSNNIFTSKGSYKLKDVNKEMHRIIDTLKKYSIYNYDKASFRITLIDHLESLTFIEDNFDKIFQNHRDKVNVLSKIASIIRWSITTIVKIIGVTKKESIDEEDFYAMMKFLYESIWKLILIFEEILKVKCKICKKQKRELIYPFLMEPNIITQDDKLYEIELINMIKEMDK